MTQSWKLLIAGLLPVVLITLMSVGSARTQTTELAQPRAKASTMIPAYDLTKEVRIEGTIQKIETTGADGLIGTHILVQTVNGIIDVHLGFGGASKPQSLGIALAQGVSVIGMMQAVGNSNVLLARVLTTPNHIFVLRNEHGMPVRATPRGSAAAKALQRGL